MGGRNRACGLWSMFPTRRGKQNQEKNEKLRASKKPAGLCGECSCNQRGEGGITFIFLDCGTKKKKAKVKEVLGGRPEALWSN